jgi:hypothetical protein
LLAVVTPRHEVSALRVADIRDEEINRDMATIRGWLHAIIN